MNNNYYVFWDTETSSIDPNVAQILSLGAVAVDPRRLEIIEDSEFYTLVKPEDEATIEPKALEVNKLKLEDLRQAPTIETAWKSFVSYLDKYKKGKNKWGRPIAGGYNIVGYDLIIAERLNNKFGLKDLFHPRDKLDVMQDMFRWTESNAEITSLSFDNMRQWLGMSQESKDNAHNALSDAKDAAYLGIRLLNLYRNVKVRFANAFANAGDKS